MRKCREVSSRYALADKVHVDVNLEIQGTGEGVKAAVGWADEVWARHNGILTDILSQRDMLWI